MDNRIHAHRFPHTVQGPSNDGPTFLRSDCSIANDPPRLDVHFPIRRK